jgi:hypothetical protein
LACTRIVRLGRSQRTAAGRTHRDHSPHAVDVDLLSQTLEYYCQRYIGLRQHLRVASGHADAHAPTSSHEHDVTTIKLYSIGDASHVRNNRSDNAAVLKVYRRIRGHELSIED